jgi:Fe-S cluster biogenesis protein NfuA
MSVDHAALARRIASLNTLIDSHAGGLELLEVSVAGCVTVRFTGMCMGCDYRQLTTAGTVEPALMDVGGVTEVRIAGARVSQEAQARIAATMAESGALQRAVMLVRRMEAMASPH